MLGEFLSQAPSASRTGVDSVVDGDLALVYVEEFVDVLSALLEDL